MALNLASLKTPGVYIDEVSVFPPSVAQVETAIPAFVGFTEKATRTTAGDLANLPTKIYSLKQFEQYFGGPKDDPVTVTLGGAAGSYTLVSVTEPDVRFLLYFAIKLFFDNGGGQCYIVSVGGYEDPSAAGPTTEQRLLAGLEKVGLEDEPTLLVVPEAVKLTASAYGTVTAAVLAQCDALQDRFAILDVFDGASELGAGTGGTLETNRALFGNRNLKYGAAYYPFLKTTFNFHVNPGETNVLVAGSVTGTLASLVTVDTAAYNFVKAVLAERYVVMPPSGAIAGVYAATDSNRGVWKAPANVSLVDVIEPTVRVANTLQDALNVDAVAGKSINVVRAFAGRGILVWGARTLAGNDNEWRYVPVRRFFNTVEESVKKSTMFAVFEPNDANLWVRVRGIIENYLTQQWRDGALAGATTKDAFFVRVGLGVTMSAQDILEGRLIVEIGMAVVRPAEFIVMRFSHKLQTT